MKKLNIEKQTIIHLLLYNFLFISICFTQNTERHPKSNHNYNSFNRDQEFVYHTIGNMWFSWDNYGNAGDQSCSALYPSFNYPGGGNLTYQCRGGYWVLSYFAENDDYLEVQQVYMNYPQEQNQYPTARAGLIQMMPILKNLGLAKLFMKQKVVSVLS